MITLGTVPRNFRPFTKDPNRPNYDYRHGIKYDMYECYTIKYQQTTFLLKLYYYLGYVTVNLTYPVTVTRHGGTETFNLE